MPVPGRAKKSPTCWGTIILKTGNMKECRTLYYKHYSILVFTKPDFLYQRKVYYLLHRFYIVKLYTLDKAALDLIHVFFILPAEDNLF